MDLSTFTERSREALVEAQNIATRHQHQAVDVGRMFRSRRARGCRTTMRRQRATMLDIIFSSRPSFGFATFCPTQNVTPPDEIATRNDLLNELQSAIQSWPPEEREIFELYFVEGFETDE